MSIIKETLLSSIEFWFPVHLGWRFFFFFLLLTSRYYANTESYLKAVALKRMPPNLQTVDMLKAGRISSVMSFSHLRSLIYSSLNDLWILLSAFRQQTVVFAVTFPLSVTLNHMLFHVIPVPQPCLDSFVFLRVKETQENILVEPETDDQR